MAQIEEAKQIALRHHQAGRLGEAEAMYRMILGHRPDDVDVLNNLGIALSSLGKHAEAVETYRRALLIQPNLADVQSNLGNVLQNLGFFEEAIECYQRAIGIQPDLAEAHDNLGTALSRAGKIEEAARSFQTAIRLRPDFALPYNNLGNALKDMGRVDEAIGCYRHALKLAPGFLLAHNSLLYTLQFHPECDGQMIRAEQGRWNRQHAEALARFITPHGNDRNPDRRLRIGYVSPDFRLHAESFFVVPLLEHHDHERFEVHCYSSVVRADWVTERIRRCADGWHEVYGLSDHELAQRIRDDRIDILVDLTMHMGSNRLLAFACKPAPIQISWLAYPGSTGLATMDYRLSDRYLDPNESEVGSSSERAIRLPDCWISYDPLSDEPLPRYRKGQSICFGSLNNPCKVHDALLRLWAKVLQAVPGSRLRMLVIAASHQKQIVQLLGELGISSERLEFVGLCDRSTYLKIYERIDIGLDTLPYNGITTTCDALWMGVPVITLTGKSPASRAGQGILSTLGLSELVAHSPQEFVEIAVGLSRNGERLEQLHLTLRDRMCSSPLMNHARFAGQVESAYRQVWRNWCASGKHS